jgi:hypothetical protein
MYRRVKHLGEVPRMKGLEAIHAQSFGWYPHLAYHEEAQIFRTHMLVFLCHTALSAFRDLLWHERGPLNLGNVLRASPGTCIDQLIVHSVW